MNLDCNTLIGFVAGSATAAVCGYAYSLYRERRRRNNRKSQHCQVNPPKKRTTATQVPKVARCDKEVQAGPLKHNKRVQFKLPMVSTATQADMDSEALCMTDASCHVSVADLGGVRSVSSQTEGKGLACIQVPSSESLDDCDTFYDAQESPIHSQEQILSYEEIVPRTSSLMGHLKYMLGPTQSLVENKWRSETNDKASEESEVTQSASQRSPIQSEDSLDDVVEECDTDDVPTLF